MIGQQFTEKRGGAVWAIVGNNGDHRWIIQRVDQHAPAAAVSTAELEARFKVKVEPPAPGSAEDGWRALSEAAAEKATLATRRPSASQPTPEEVFASVEG